jgi:hypothetical protein
VIAAHLLARSREGILAVEVKGTMARLLHIAAFTGLAALSAAGGAVATIGLIAPDLLRARMSPAPVHVAQSQGSLPASSPREIAAPRETIEAKVEPLSEPLGAPLTAPSPAPVADASLPAPDRPASGAAGRESAAQEIASQEVASQELALQEIAAHAPPPPDLAVFGALRHPTVEPAPSPRMASLAAPLASFSPTATPLETLALSFARAPIPEDALPPPTGADALDGPEEFTAREPAAPEASEHAALVEPQRPRTAGPVIVIDASEGTRLDPLRQKNWDLNAVQVIPAITPPKR